MSATPQTVLKDVFEIYQRLFDHSSAIRGEVNFFFQNFKDGDDISSSSSSTNDSKQTTTSPTQLETLLRCSQLANEARDIDWQKTIDLSDIDKVNVKLDAAATMMEKLVERGRNRRGAGPYGEYVERSKQEQLDDLQRFSADIQQKKDRVDEEFRERVDDLRRHFENLGLHKSS